MNVSTSMESEVGEIRKIRMYESKRHLSYLYHSCPHTELLKNKKVISVSSLLYKMLSGTMK